MAEDTKNMAEDVDQSFNDDELQDIMNEIESLEKEFVEEDLAPSDEEVHDEPLQQAQEEVAEPIDEEVVSTGPVQSEEENVVPMKERPTSSASGADMEFSGAGSLDFNLCFKVAGQVASLKVDGDHGFSLHMDGVDLSIDEQGCTVTMQGGVKFTVPFGAEDVAKKAS